MFQELLAKYTPESSTFRALRLWQSLGTTKQLHAHLVDGMRSETCGKTSVAWLPNADHLG